MTRQHWRFININETVMKRILTLLLPGICCVLRVASQQPALGDKIEKEFEVSAVPEKWKNESAVIIGHKTEYLFTRLASGRKFTPVVRINEFIHKRVRLQDKNALEKFSTFYYV